ncbi:putative HAD superfamily protein [Peribacillus deserti]|uniref:Nucleotidase n=1 Tax=Peribacillus deserti TaxID=673318 RepID=A0ABS2QD37_9BACI|nr:HAD family acid phosphatase [Peribacillus deserti]MBM7691081.1 putative HAD superfamily protein [Peribacillus deserti]
MKFGFDIDDTLINLREHAFHIYNRRLNKNVGLDVYHALNTVEIHEAFGLSAAEGKKMWNSLLHEIYYTSCPPLTNAVETLQELDKQGHEIYYITARPKEHEEGTRKWMTQQGFPMQEGRFFCGMKDEEKIQIIRSLKLDYYFDDKPAVLETLSSEKLKVYVMNQSYNLHMKIPRITSWSELKDIITK